MSYNVSDLPDTHGRSQSMASRKTESQTLDVCKKCGQVHTRCLAHKSKRDENGKLVPCGQRAMKTSRTHKCQSHGGKIPKGPESSQYKHGKFATASKINFIPDPKLIERTQSLAHDLIANLDDSVKIGAMIESRYLEKIGTTESTAAWIELRKAVNAYKKAEDEVEKAIAFAVIDKIVEHGLGEVHLIRDIQAAQESQRKITETAIRGRKERSETMTNEQFNWGLAKLVHIVTTHVADRNTLAKIYGALEQAYLLESSNP